MLEPLRSIAIACLAVAASAGPLASTANADTRCGGPGRPSCTILRADEPATAPRPDLGAPRCVVIVGGLASTPTRTEEAFRPIRALLEGLGGVEVERFDYDSSGPIAPAALQLVVKVQSLRPSCAEIHVIAHSMGGVIADRAFSLGLSSADGVATYLPFASPHNGATAARELCGVGEVDPEYTALLRTVAAVLDAPDPAAPAVCDLARVKAPRPARGVSSARLRLVSDELVLRRDHLARGRDVRELLPSFEELGGHGRVLTTERTLWTIERAVADGVVPPDDRDPEHRIVAGLASVEMDAILAQLFATAGDAIWLGALEARAASLLRELVRSSWHQLRPPGA